MKEYGPPPGKESLDERRLRLAKVKEDYEKSLKEFDMKAERVALMINW